MKNEFDELNTKAMGQAGAEMMNETPNFDILAKGVATGVVATIIVESGKGAIGTLAKNPFVMFGLGLVTGYFAHKYRKEIISVTHKTAEHGKDFIVRQKENLKNRLPECREALEEDVSA